MYGVNTLLKDKNKKRDKVFLANTLRIFEMDSFNKKFMPKYIKLADDYGTDFLERVATYCIENATNAVNLFTAMLKKGANLAKTIANFKDRIEVVKEVLKKMPTVYKGFVHKMYTKIGKRILNIMDQSSDAKTPPATFIYKCNQYVQ